MINMTTWHLELAETKCCRGFFFYLCFPVCLHLSDQAFERIHSCQQSISFLHPALDVKLAARITFCERKLGQRKHLHALLVHLTEQCLSRHKKNPTQTCFCVLKKQPSETVIFCAIMANINNIQILWKASTERGTRGHTFGQPAHNAGTTTTVTKVKNIRYQLLLHWLKSQMLSSLKVLFRALSWCWY